MKYTVEFTPDAEADLADIFDYLYVTEPLDRASQIVEGIVNQTLELAEMPERGFAPRELSATVFRHYRQFVHKQYRVIYRIAASRVEVLLVADGRRDFRALFKERLKP